MLAISWSASFRSVDIQEMVVDVLIKTLCTGLTRTVRYTYTSLLVNRLIK